MPSTDTRSTAHTAPILLTTTQLAELLDAAEGIEFCCPHCDAWLHRPTTHCWCAGCDACDRVRASERRLVALANEWSRRRWPDADADIPADDGWPF